MEGHGSGLAVRAKAGHGQGSYHSGLAIPQSIFGILEWKIEGNGSCTIESWSYLHGDRDHKVTWRQLLCHSVDIGVRSDWVGFW